MPERAIKTEGARRAPPEAPLASVAPLEEFYRESGLTLPPWQAIEGAAIPQPYRKLLVHQNDMTPTLEGFYRQSIHLRVLGRRRKNQGTQYSREVVLLLDGTDQPVEFGAIRIHLERFAKAAQSQILEEVRPLGHILEECKIAHQSRPQGYLRIASDKLINEALRLTGANVLYGRRNVLLDPRQRVLAEIVEILPPVKAS